MTGDMPTGAFPPSPIPKAALVTGAGQRIGRACALALADEGYAVAVHYHASEKPARSVVTEIEQNGGKALAIAADLADEVQVAALLPRAAEVLGPIGVLVNNASIFENDTVGTVTKEGWDAHLAVNLRAPFVLMQAFARPGGRR